MSQGGTLHRSSGKVSLNGIHLKPHDMQALATILYNIDHLSILELVNCHLDKKCLEALAKSLRGSSVKIDVLDVSFNKNLHADALFHLHEICLRTSGLNYWQCGFKQYDLLTFLPTEHEKEEPTGHADENEESEIGRKFHENGTLDVSSHNADVHLPLLESLVTFGGTQAQEIIISLSEFSPSTVMPKVVSLIEKCTNVGRLEITECDFSDEQLQQIEEAMGDKKVKALNMSLSHYIDLAGWKTLGSMTRKFSVDSLFLTACNLSDEKLHSFLGTAMSTKLGKLDVSRNENMDSSCMTALGSIVTKCRVEELIMGYCKLTHEGLKGLLQTVQEAKLHRLDVSGNDKMGADEFSALGQIVKSCEVQELDISECDPIPKEIRSFKDSVAGAKMTKLNVSRNRRMRERGLQDIGELVGETHLHELFIRQCNLDQNTLLSFKRGLATSQIPRLDLGHYFMKDRKTTDEELQIAVSFLENITDQLTLNKWEFGEERRQFLRTTLTSIPYKGLKIHLNRSTDDFIEQEK